MFDGCMYYTHIGDVGGGHTPRTPVCGDRVNKVADDRAKEFGFVGWSGVLPEDVCVLDQTE